MPQQRFSNDINEPRSAHMRLLNAQATTIAVRDTECIDPEFLRRIRQRGRDIGPLN